MKTHLVVSSLFILGGYAAIELAKSTGVPLPAALNLGNAFIAFSVVSVALLLVADYGPKVPQIKLPVRATAVRPVRCRSIAASYHHLYAIRRGPEAARLAPAPARVLMYPKNTLSSDKRAA